MYHILQIGEKSLVRGEEEKPARTGFLTKLQDKGDILDLPKAKIHSSIGLHLPLNTIDSRKIPDCLWGKDSALSEDDLTILLKYIALLYLSPDTIEKFSKIFAAQCSLFLNKILTPGFSKALSSFIAK